MKNENFSFEQGLTVGLIIATGLQRQLLHMAGHQSDQSEVATQADRLLAEIKAVYRNKISPEFPDGIPTAAFDAAYGKILELFKET